MSLIEACGLHYLCQLQADPAQGVTVLCDIINQSIQLEASAWVLNRRKVQAKAEALLRLGAQ